MIIVGVDGIHGCQLKTREITSEEGRYLATTLSCRYTEVSVEDFKSTQHALFRLLTQSYWKEPEPCPPAYARVIWWEDTGLTHWETSVPSCWRTPGVSTIEDKGSLLYERYFDHYPGTLHRFLATGDAFVIAFDVESMESYEKAIRALREIPETKVSDQITLVGLYGPESKRPYISADITIVTRQHHVIDITYISKSDSPQEPLAGMFLDMAERHVKRVHTCNWRKEYMEHKPDASGPTIETQQTEAIVSF